MFGSESDFDEQSGLLRSGKRYKRDFGSYTLGQNTEEDSKSEETSSVRNPPTTPKNSLQSESNFSPSIPVAGQSTPVSPPPAYYQSPSLPP